MGAEQARKRKREGCGEKANKGQRFPASIYAFLHRDVSTDGLVCREILRQLNCRDTMEDVTVVRAICSAVSTRAAKLVTAGLAAVIKKMGRKTLTIGVDGSLYKYHPRFHPLMDTFTRELVPEARVKYMLSEDGSGKGAALIAAVAVRLTGKSFQKPCKITPG